MPLLLMQLYWFQELELVWVSPCSSALWSVDIICVKGKSSGGGLCWASVVPPTCQAGWKVDQSRNQSTADSVWELLLLQWSRLYPRPGSYTTSWVSLCQKEYRQLSSYYTEHMTEALCCLLWRTLELNELNVLWREKILSCTWIKYHEFSSCCISHESSDITSHKVVASLVLLPLLGIRLKYW